MRCDIFFLQLCWTALRGDKGLQQIGRLSAGCLLRGQSIPEQLERRLRGRCMEIRSMQLGGKTSGQCQRSSSSWPTEGQERQSEVRHWGSISYFPLSSNRSIHLFLFFPQIRIRRSLLPHGPAWIHLRILPPSRGVAIAQATDFPQRFRGAAFRALVVLQVKKKKRIKFDDPLSRGLNIRLVEIGQVRPLLPGYEHERSHVHGFYRRCDREDSHASSHAIVPNFPLQLEILRQWRGRLRRRVVETFRHAGKPSWETWWKWKFFHAEQLFIIHRVPV